MIPTLYSKNETSFETNGIGRLCDAIKVLVTEERNGVFELEMDYPIHGEYYSNIELNSIIKAAPNETDPEQLFYVYSITRYLSGYATFYCRHISYRLCGIPVKPFSANSASAAMAGLITNAVKTPGFTLSTNITSTTAWSTPYPQSLKSLLGGVEGSLLDTYGGEFRWNNFEVSLLKSRGNNTGVTIRYGKNLTDMVHDTDIESTYNGIFPYWYREGNGVVYPGSASVTSNFSYPYACYEIVDMSSDYDQKPAASTLKNKADTQAGKLALPTPNIDISFVALWKMNEFDLIEALERVSLCDTVTVIYEALGVDIQAKVVKTVYNVLADMYESIEVGAPRSTLSDLIADQTSDGVTVFGSMSYLARGTATSATSGTSVTQITLNTKIIDTSDNNFSFSSGGVKVAKAGLYRVSGSAYITPNSSTTTLGTYIKIGSSFANGTEVNSQLQGMATTGARAIQCIPRLVNITAGQIVFLASRCRGTAGTVDASHETTFLQIERVL